MTERFLLFIFLFFFSTGTQKETIYGKVVGVTDGDSITVLLDSHVQLKVRLEGIDCPEHKQDYGEKAKQITAALCFNKMVRLETTGKDRYGRTLAFVYIDQVCINKELLIRGMAWHFVKYNHDPELAKLEKEARRLKVGLWAMPYPVPPWEFRHKRK